MKIEKAVALLVRSVVVHQVALLTPHPMTDSINTLVLAAVRSAIERRVDVAMALLQEIAKGGPVRQEKYTAIDIWYLIILKDCSPSSVRIRVRSPSKGK